MTRICSNCKIEKSFENFYKEKRRKYGISYWCKDCHRKYSESENGKVSRTKYDHKRHKARSQLLGKIKMARGCVDCGYNKHPAALQFDHVYGEKLFNVGVRKATVSMQKLEKEIYKCEVRCANCHAIITYRRKQEENLCLEEG